MNFKEWLQVLETTVRIRPSKTPGPGGAPPPVADRSSLYGLAGQHAHPGTQVPISTGINNQAVTGFLAGIGSGIGKAQADSGFESRPIPQISPFPTLTKTHIETGHLPLQLPVIPPKDWLPGFDSEKLTSYDVDISKQIFNYVQDPINDERVRRENDNPPSSDPKSKTKFGSLAAIPEQNQNEFYGKAKNFTRALIKISIINKMREQQLDRKYNLAKGKLGKEHVENDTLVCAFYFEPYKTIDQEEVKE